MEGSGSEEIWNYGKGWRTRNITSPLDVVFGVEL